MLSGQVRTNHLPGTPAVFSLEQNVSRIIKNMRINRGKHDWLGPIHTILLSDRDRCHILNLTRTPMETRNFVPAGAVNDVLIKWIRRNITVLDHANRMPIATRDLTIIAAA